MKPALLILTHLLLFPLLGFGGKGAFIVLQNTNFYQTDKMENRVFRSSAKKAYAIDSYKSDRKRNIIKLRIKTPLSVPRTKIEGYILRTQDKQEKSKNLKLKIFKKIPGNDREKADYVMVSSNAIISKTPIKQKKLSTVEWDKVEYFSSKENLYWVYSNAGIYRPDLSPDELNARYAILRKRGFSYSRMVLILSGVVNTGSSTIWVKLALGTPLEVNKLKNNQQEWIYPNQKIYFRGNRVRLTVYNLESRESQ